MEKHEVMIVDDDADTAMFMEMKLSRAAPGFAISTADSGFKCLELMKSRRFDCILADYQMPGMDGMELLRRIRAEGYDTPFIFVTGQGNEEVASEAFKSGANDYFTKEIGFAHFPRIINSVEQAVSGRMDRENRKKAEAALHEEKNKLETILASIGDAISIHDTQYRILYQNAACLDLLGDHVGEYCYRAYQNREDVCEGCPSLETFRDGGIKRAEKKGITTTGELMDTEVTASPLRDSSGDIIAAIEVIRDVTERKRARDKIASLNRLYSVTTGINQLIIRTSDKTRLFREACGLAVERGGFRLAWVGLLDEDTGEVKPAAYSGQDNGFLEAVPVTTEERPEGYGCTGAAVRTGLHFLCNDLERAPSTLPWRDMALVRGYRSCGAFPIVVDKQVVGAFTVYSADPGFFSEEEIGLLDDLVSDISFALHHIEQEDSRRRAEKEREDAWLLELAALREAEKGQLTLAAILDSVPEGLAIADASDGGIKMMSRQGCEMLGIDRSSLEGMPVQEHAGIWGLFRPGAFSPLPAKETPLGRALLSGEVVSQEELVLRPAGKGETTVLFSAAPIRDVNDTIAGAITAWADISSRKRMEENLRSRERQQAAVAELGQSALTCREIDELFDEAVNAVSRSLDVEYCKVLELLPSGRELLLRSGVGWKEGVVGHATVGTELSSQAGYTLRSDLPVIVVDLRAETRFSGPPLLLDHGVVSGISVIIGGMEHPFGVMGAHTIQRRLFNEYDVSFLQSVANVLAAAIELRKVEDTLRKSEESLTMAQSVAHMGNWDWNIATGELSWSDEIYRIFGIEPRMFGATYEAFLESVHPEDREMVKGAVNRALYERAPYSIQHRIVLPDGSVRTVHELAEVYFDEEGRPARMVGTVQDISMRMAA